MIPTCRDVLGRRLTVTQAWRMLTRSYMPESDRQALLAYSPMLHARLFNETSHFRDRHFQPCRKAPATKPEQKEVSSTTVPYLDGNPSLDRPLIVQFCANDPDELLQAASRVQPHCDAVDLNLGCPQGIAKKGNYGAFLQEDQELVYRLIKKLHDHLDVPVTAKIRILESKENTLAYAKKVLDAGASILTVHGRQRDQKGHKTGLADWSVLRYLRRNLPPETVIFANGNILRHDDMERCLEETGADAVMSAEGNLHDPTIFATPPPIGQEGREYWRGRDGRGGYRMDAVFRRYMDILYEHVLEISPPKRNLLFIPSDPLPESVPSPTQSDRSPGDDERPRKRQKRGKAQERPSSLSLVVMQPHLFHLLRPLVTKHTHIRDALARCRAGDLEAYEKVLQMTEAAVREGLFDYQTNPSKYDEQEPLSEKFQKEAENADESSLTAVRDCKRPWWVCQPYVRPLPKEAMEKGSITMSKKEKKKMESVKSLAPNQSGQISTRELLDRSDGVPVAETAQSAMVAG